MKNPCVWLVAIALMMISCAKRPVPRFLYNGEGGYVFEEEKFVGETAYYARCYPNRKLMRIGQYAYDSNGRLSDLQTGKWAEYYENGQVREMGNYLIGRYIYCGALPFRAFYHYKTGYWQYFYPNGQLKANGTYKIVPLNMRTNCEGGDDLLFGLTTNRWQFFNESGEHIVGTDSLRKALEQVSLMDGPVSTMFTPDKEFKKLIATYKHISHK